jgi:hypothetical protein
LLGVRIIYLKRFIFLEFEDAVFRGLFVQRVIPDSTRFPGAKSPHERQRNWLSGDG